MVEHADFSGDRQLAAGVMVSMHRTQCRQCYRTITVYHSRGAKATETLIRAFGWQEGAEGWVCPEHRTKGKYR